MSFIYRLFDDFFLDKTYVQCIITDKYTYALGGSYVISGTC